MSEGSNKPRIFVIDDSHTVLTVLEHELTQAGFAVQTASDPGEIDPATLAQVEAIVVDVQMEQVFGDDVVSFMRQAWELTAPIFLFSSLPQAELTARARAAGASGAVSKKSGVPVLIEELKRTLEAT